MKKEYTNGDITVIWQPGLCIHSGYCFRHLPGVFRPREKPWVQMDKSDTPSIEETVKGCPSGALSLKPNETIPAVEIPSQPSSAYNVLIMANGPVRIKHPCIITLPDGSQVEKPNGTALCRCGGSSSYPFCDGSHRTNGFKG
jgi:uncharacterized Fe-S cluster protein YjdI